MSGEHPGAQPADPPTAARPGQARRFQIGVRGLIVAVACFGLVAWAGRSIWENQHPAIEAARGFRSSDPADRVATARQLAMIGLGDPGRSIPPLVAALGDPEAEVRSAAAESLGAIISDRIRNGYAEGPARAGVEGLIGALKDRDATVRTGAVQALQTIGYASGTAGAIDLPAVIDALAATSGDKDDGVRLAAIWALGQCGPIIRSDPPAALVALLEDRSAPHRTAALGALASFPAVFDPHLPTLLRGLEQSEPEHRQAYWYLFARGRPPGFSAAAIPGLVAALGSRSRSVRSHAAQALYPLASDPRAAVAAPALLAMLKEPIDPKFADPETRSLQDGWDPSIVAAHDLGRIAPGTQWAGPVIASLTEILRSDHPYRWLAAANALGEFGPAAEPTVPALIHVLRKDHARSGADPYSYASAAARALGRITPGTKSAEEALAVLTQIIDAPPESHPAATFGAIEALPAFGPAAARALPRLRALREAGDFQIKTAAEKAVAAIEGDGPADPGR